MRTAAASQRRPAVACARDCVGTSKEVRDNAEKRYSLLPYDSADIA